MASLKKLLQQGISEPEVYSLEIAGKNIFGNNSESFITGIKE